MRRREIKESVQVARFDAWFPSILNMIRNKISVDEIRECYQDELGFDEDLFNLIIIAAQIAASDRALNKIKP
jgi:hypothetical protein